MCLPVHYAEERSEQVKGPARETKKKKRGRCRGTCICGVLIFEWVTYIPLLRNNGVRGYYILWVLVFDG